MTENVGAVKREDNYFDIVDRASGARVIRFPSDERPFRLEFGERVTYNSPLPAKLGHPDGIVFDAEQVQKLGIPIIKRPEIEAAPARVQKVSL